jgi:RNA polymerase sigma-70 factor, ECF subfamily
MPPNVALYVDDVGPLGGRVEITQAVPSRSGRNQAGYGVDSVTNRGRRLALLGGRRRRVPTFHAIYKEYFNFVWSCAARLGVERSALDDVVQEVFIVIHAKLHSLENPEALRSWIYSVVRRTASNHRRTLRMRAAAGIEIDIEDAIRSPKPTPFEQAERSAELALAASLLAELDEPKREVFALVELHELTVPEVAATLGIPLNTAYSRLRLARQAFEAALDRHRARSKGTR